MSLPKDQTPNDLPSKLQIARVNLQKTLSSSKSNGAKPKPSNSLNQTKESSVKIEKNPPKERLSSLSRVNSVSGTGTIETSFFNKNIEDFLLTNTQPLENVQRTRYSLLSSPPKTEGNLDPAIEDFPIYTEILEKMKNFRKQRPKNMEDLINAMLRKCEKKREIFYDFLSEKDLLTLRFLALTLYENLETIRKDKIDGLEQKLMFSQRNASVLQDELLEKNIQINTISTKFYILLQKAKDFLWLVGETRKELRNMMNEEWEGFSFTRKTTIDNLLKEFETLEKKMQEFEIRNEGKINLGVQSEKSLAADSRSSREELSFFKKFEESRKNVRDNIRGICKEKEKEKDKSTPPLKENTSVLNKSFSNKSLEIFEKELKKSQEKILFLIDEKSAIEKNLYDTQLLNRELSTKFTELRRKIDEKESEVNVFSRRLETKDAEIVELIEKLRISGEKLLSESTVKEKKESKLQMIEKELQEIKKITGLKENEHYMLDLKNKALEGELHKSKLKIEVLEKEIDAQIEKLKEKHDNNNLEAVVQCLSSIILSKHDNHSSQKDEAILKIKQVCGDNVFRILQDVYLKINEYEVEMQALKDKSKEQTKVKNLASQAALYFAKNLLNFFELIEKSSDENGFRMMLKEKFSNLNEMKSKYMEVINELTFCEIDTPNNAHEMSFSQKDENAKKAESSGSKKKQSPLFDKENICRPPFNDKMNNLSFSSLNFSDHNSNVKRREKNQALSATPDNQDIYLFLLNQAASIEQLLKSF